MAIIPLAGCRVIFGKLRFKIGYFLYMDKMEKQQQAQRQWLDQQLNVGGQEDEKSDPFAPARQTWPF